MAAIAASLITIRAMLGTSASIKYACTASLESCYQWLGGGVMGYYSRLTTRVVTDK